METPSDSSNIPGIRLPDKERAGDILGAFRLCEVIGEGGFGTVWRAEQSEPVRREVALKILKPGLDSRKVLGRFAQERQALATLQHPGIAVLLDAGVVAGGRPWFAMELVRGAPIVRWCVEEKLPLDERLRLFQQVCLAVHHAHQRGIIHRDLKPSNVLVTRVAGRSVAKVIDFGIAKCVQEDAEASLLTMAGQQLGTPWHMSPEQTQDSSSIDVRSDVYSLGVLLYELITEELPIDASTAGGEDEGAIKRAIREQTPERPSRRTRARTSTAGGMPRAALAAAATPVLSIPADLDWIALHALEKEPARRYQTAAEFAEDVRRHLDHEVVKARPPSLTYVVRRWLQRHKRVVAASALGMGGTAALIFACLPVADTKQDTEVVPPVAAAVERPPASAPPQPLPAAEVAARGITNSLGMKFVPVPGADVLFCIHETRRRDFASMVSRNPFNPAKTGWMIQNEKGWPCGANDDEPVVGVTWDEAQTFCQWLGQVEDRHYRLPTDHEWSIAAGTGPAENEPEKTTPERLAYGGWGVFPFGTAFPPVTGSRAGNYADQSLRKLFPNAQFLQGYEDGFPLTAPVMSFQANPFGLFDLGGNVWEYCQDTLNPRRTDRVIRGASWSNVDRGDMKTAARHEAREGTISNRTGFRCVLVPGAKAPPFTMKGLDPGYKPPPPLVPPHPAAVSALQAQAGSRFPETLSLADAEKQQVTNSLGMKLLPVPGTSVLFCIHETRIKDYAAYAAAAPQADMSWKVPATAGAAPDVSKADHPVSTVNWQDAQDFCAWLSRKEGRTYRLPTDREWSWAVGIGPLETWGADTTPQTVFKALNHYPWESAYPPPAGAGNWGDKSRKREVQSASVIAGYDDTFARTAPVMSFQRNRHGLYDMGGNVMEWCEDAFDSRHLEVGLRGACWYTGGEAWTSSSFRITMRHTHRPEGAGFRIVLEP